MTISYTDSSDKLVMSEKNVFNKSFFIKWIYIELGNYLKKLGIKRIDFQVRNWKFIRINE